MILVICSKEIPQWRDGGAGNFMPILHLMNLTSVIHLKRITDLKPDESGRIERVDCSDAMVALMELGCVVGETLEMRQKAPFGGPVAVSTGGHVFAMRKAQAHEVWVSSQD